VALPPFRTRRLDVTDKNAPRQLPARCQAELDALPILNMTRDQVVREVNGSLGEYAGIRTRHMTAFHQSNQNHVTEIGRAISRACDDFLDADAKRRGIQR
jgi:hypothetical protein